MKTNKNGISLIVLVITIIVMIILAAAIILSISGSDIRGKTNEAVSSSDISSAKELVAVARSEWESDYDVLSNQYEHFGKYANKKLEEKEIKNVVVGIDGAVNIIYEDKNGDIAIIPEGFTISTVKSEQTIEDGLVILDKDGNEFVWVPVNDYENRFKRTIKYKATEDITDPGTSSYTEPFSKTTTDGIKLSLSNDLTGEYAEEAKMRESVKENKGFYIARYEAGTPVARINTANRTTEVIVQKNKPVYNYVGWGPSMADAEGDVIYSDRNQGKGAVELSRQMYKSSKSVVSTLCYGVQWDATLQFIATKDEDYITDSTGKGNYTGSILKTSSSEDYAINNIYNMAGNVREWTMEAISNDSNSYRVLRGGSYDYDGSRYPSSHRYASSPNHSFLRHLRFPHCTLYKVVLVYDNRRSRVVYKHEVNIKE